MSLARVVANISLALAATVFARAACADDYPNRPVQMIVDSAAGSANDVTARVIGDKLGQIWGRQVVVLNAPGAGGGIAARQAASAAPDGYTLFIPSTSTFIAQAGAPGVTANMPAKLPQDFAGIGLVLEQPLFIGASPKLPERDLAAVIARAKAKPGSVTYAATGRGRLTHLAMELMQAMAGVKMELVAYAGGPTQAMSDVIEGRVDLTLDAYGGLAGALQGKLIRGLAVTSRARSPEFPDIPTVAETLPGYVVDAWTILVAPKDTPKPLVDRISADLRTAVADPQVQAKIRANGGEVRPMGPAETTAYVQAEQAKWAPILKTAMGEGK